MYPRLIEQLNALRLQELRSTRIGTGLAEGRGRTAARALAPVPPAGAAPGPTTPEQHRPRRPLDLSERAARAVRPRARV
ncbi:MAG TPA: hypothetical protein VME46_17155 [Acidimicrobiales bacterium]|nr:hypothetical protein [Acidimicrobiales bacterium]